MFSAFQERKQKRKQKRERIQRYETIARQADGRFIVSLGVIYGRSFYLTEDEIEPYFAWWAHHDKKQTRINWLILIIFILVFLLSNVEIEISALAGFVIFLAVVPANTKWAVRSFSARFPESLRARDGDRWRRFTISTLVSRPRGQCIFGVVVVLMMGRLFSDVLMMGRLLSDESVTHMSEYSALDIFSYAMIGGLIVSMGAFYAFFTFEHFRFRRRHGRAPSMDDLEPPF